MAGIGRTAINPGALLREHLSEEIRAELPPAARFPQRAGFFGRPVRDGSATSPWPPARTWPAIPLDVAANPKQAHSGLLRAYCGSIVVYSGQLGQFLENHIHIIRL